MRLLIIALLLSLNAAATDYYVNAAGSDAAAGTIGAPWLTAAKVNGFTLNPDDNVYFNRGDAFAGPLNTARSGTAGHPITFGAYGTGAKPIITGFYTVPSWTLVSGSLYEATIPSGLATLNMVMVDGAFQAIGRYPKITTTNQGYLAQQSHSGTASITSNAIAALPNFNGGELVLRPYHWIIVRGTITGQTSTTVSYTPFATPIGSPYQPLTGYGFFFQNHVNACTATGDWAYNGTTHKVTMFNGNGHTVQVSQSDNVLSITGRTYLTFNDLILTGGNSRTVLLSSSTHITLNNCDISYSGQDGIFATNSASNNNAVTNCTFTNINNNGIMLNSAPNWTITGNSFTNIGLTPGMGISGDGQYQATSYVGASSTIQLNTFTNIGYVPIHFVGTNSLVDKNLVNGFCLVKDDGGGIYSWNNGQAGSVVSNNIVLNGRGNPNGTTDAVGTAQGIYMDDNVTGVEIKNNLCAGMNYAGLLLHNANNLNIHDNTFYNNGTVIYTGGQAYYTNGAGTMANITITGNIFFSRKILQDVTNVDPSGANWPWFATADNNYYCRPLNENQCFSVNVGGFQHLNLAGWKSAIGKEGNSKSTPPALATTDTNKIRLIYNATNSPATTTFAGTTYQDVKGGVYSGSITLQPFTSAVLIQTTSTNVPPTVSAGADRTLTAGTTSVTLSGTSANDPDGTYTLSWTKLVGAAVTISGGTTLTPTFSGLSPGMYQFQVVATDNGGATATDAMTVTVSAPGNTPPTANAGSDVTITLPTSSVPLNGTGSDAEGTVTYTWSKVSGSGTITATGSQNTSITSLAAGVTVVQLRVTDLGGLSTTDQMTITVNTATPPANRPPTVSAGPDKVITLPTNSVTLAGSASDPDGTISTYSWTNISGGAYYSIATPAAAQTDITFLRDGTYRFQLAATDNSGATTTDEVIVVVNAAPPPSTFHPPVSRAGADRVVYLPATSIEMNGLATDFDGPVTVQWVKISGPACLIEKPTTVSTVVSHLVRGTYQLRLYVTDNSGNVVSDDMIITVKSCSFWDHFWGRCK